MGNKITVHLGWIFLTFFAKIGRPSNLPDSLYKEKKRWFWLFYENISFLFLAIEILTKVQKKSHIKVKKT